MLLALRCVCGICFAVGTEVSPVRDVVQQQSGTVFGEMQRAVRCQCITVVGEGLHEDAIPPRAPKAARLRVLVWNIETSSLTSRRIKGTRLRHAYNEINNPLQRPSSTGEHRDERLRAPNSEDRKSILSEVANSANDLP